MYREKNNSGIFMFQILEFFFFKKRKYIYICAQEWEFGELAVSGGAGRAASAPAHRECRAAVPHIVLARSCKNLGVGAFLTTATFAADGTPLARGGLPWKTASRGWSRALPA